MGKRVDITGQKFNRLIAIEPTEQRAGSSILWKCLCDCGNFTLASSSSLKNGHKKSCGCLHAEQRSKLGKSKGTDLLGQQFGDLLVIEKTDKRKDGRIVWKAQCKCGQIIEVSTSQLTQKERSHCGCKNINSNGENKIKELLNNHKIPYLTEYIFSECISPTTHRKLRFDFFVNNQYLIEFDGKQHFLYDRTGYGRELEEIQYRDSVKNNFAFNNNIPLIRIPYTHLKDLRIEDLLLETSNFVIKGVETNNE